MWTAGDANVPFAATTLARALVPSGLKLNDLSDSKLPAKQAARACAGVMFRSTGNYRKMLLPLASIADSVQIQGMALKVKFLPPGDGHQIFDELRVFNFNYVMAP